MNDLVVNAECANCEPWVRLWPSAATGIRVRQVLHEPTCTAYPKLTRHDIVALTGD